MTNSKLQALRKGWEIFQPFRMHFAVMLGMLAVYEALVLFGPYFIGQVLNSLQAEEPLSKVLMFIGIAFAVSIAAYALACVRDQYEIRYVDFSMANHLTSLTMSKVLGLSIGQHRSQNSGITHSVINKGENALKQMTFLLLYTILPVTATTIITCFLLLWFNALIGIVVTGGILIYTLIAILINRRYHPEVKELSELFHKTNKRYTEIIRHPTLIQIQSQEGRVQAEHDERLEFKKKEGQRVWLPYNLRMWGNFSLTAVIRYSALTIGALLIYNEGYLFGDFLILWAWTNQATSQVGMINRLQRQWLEHWSEAKKFFALLDVEPSIKMAENPVCPESFRGLIEFHNVEFTYDEKSYIEDDKNKKESKKKCEPALRGASFRINPGEKVAFVGESGAGKSTIVNLLVYGWAPDNGKILVDGEDIRNIDFQKFRSSLGVVEQDVVLFDNTLRYNLLFGLNGTGDLVTDEDLARIAKLTCIDKFWSRLTDGWDTRIGENGVKLSGGQRQRVALARALIKDSSVLILDEATSSLDVENESLIKEAVNEVSVGRTTIIIAHRLSTVRDADKIFVMYKGRIVAEGQHKELYENSDIYRNLVSKQLVPF